MSRVKKGSAKRQHKKKVLKETRGHQGAAHRLYRVALEYRMRAMRWSVSGRKEKKRDFRGLWIIRISAACRMRGCTYSRFIAALAEKNITLNRKMLAEIAVRDPAGFDQVLALSGVKLAVPA